MGHSCTIPLDIAVEAWEEEFSHGADDHVAWLHALFMVLGTEIAHTSAARLPASVRGDTRRHLRHSEVSVVRLRRFTARPHDEEAGSVHRPVDWQWQWPVQGHHRHLDAHEGHHHATPLPDERGTCAICLTRITWVKPHMKGPEDRPVRPEAGDVLYRLQR
jgi:hypothetical protein